MYISALKSLQGVRETTRTDLVLLETGMPTLQELIKMRSTTFIKKNVNGSIDVTPLARVYKMCEDKGTGGYRYIKRNLDIDSFDAERNDTLRSLRQIEHDALDEQFTDVHAEAAVDTAVCDAIVEPVLTATITEE